METPVLEPPKKENRTWPIVGTIAAIVLCGLPGLCILCPGGVAVLAKWFNYSTVGFELPQWTGAAFLCVALIFVAIGVVVPILLLRKKNPVVVHGEVPPPPMPPQEPLPPAS